MKDDYEPLGIIKPAHLGDDQGLAYLGIHGDGIGAEMTGP